MLNGIMLSVLTTHVKGLSVTLSITTICNDAECHYAEFHVLFIVMLNVIIVICDALLKLHPAQQSAMMLGGIMLIFVFYLLLC